MPYLGPGPPWAHTWGTIQLMLQESSRPGRGAGEGLQARAGGPSAGSGAGQETVSSGQGEKKVAEGTLQQWTGHLSACPRDRGGRDSLGDKAGWSMPSRAFRTGEQGWELEGRSWRCNGQVI